jgi:hypothetical protein
MLGDSAGEGALTGEPKFVVRLADERFVIAEYPVPTRLVIFGPDGRFEKVVGRKGEGPGEFQYASAAFVSSNGTLRVADPGLHRETVFSNQFQVLETARVPPLFVHAIAVGPDGMVYHNGDLRTPDAVGLPIHIIEGERVIRSFGARIAVQRPDAPWLGQRAMAPVRAGVWIARRTHYWLEHWTRDGRLLAALDRNAEWFEPYLMRESVLPDKPPQPWLMAMHFTNNNTLTVLINVADADFPKGLIQRGERAGRPLFDFSDCSEINDTIIESIDVSAARVRWSAQRSECLLGFIDESTVYGYHVDEQAGPRISIYGLSEPRMPQPRERCEHGRIA